VVRSLWSLTRGIAGKLADAMSQLRDMGTRLGVRRPQMAHLIPLNSCRGLRLARSRIKFCGGIVTAYIGGIECFAHEIFISFLK
jgi:hypothetical protein